MPFVAGQGERSGDITRQNSVTPRRRVRPSAERDRTQEPGVPAGWSSPLPETLWVPLTRGVLLALTGGSWWSYYDDALTNEARAFDIDHMVPLAEA
ncbi:hypothetical protein [Streptomyces sp. NBC_00211]|uniref:hypothetical protein n=1 Tax=Streptomyces sp. NBC_00211 TaxID=2975683 RepID=UPI00386E53FD